MNAWWLYGYAVVGLFMYGTFRTSDWTEILLSALWPITLPMRLGAAFSLKTGLQ